MTKDRFEKLNEWMNAEFEETLDDLLEVEFNEPVLSEEMRKLYRQHHPDGLDGRIYFPNLLHLFRVRLFLLLILPWLLSIPISPLDSRRRDRAWRTYRLLKACRDSPGFSPEPALPLSCSCCRVPVGSAEFRRCSPY